MRRLLVSAAYALLVALAIGLLALNVAAWSGAFEEDSPATPAPKAEEPSEQEPQTVSVPPPPPPEPEPPRPPQPTSAERRTSLRITATRGDCWVEVRAGSSTGALLYAGTLAVGRTLQFAREKVWLRLGAASNVDVVVNGRPSDVPPGTVELVLPA